MHGISAAAHSDMLVLGAPKIGFSQGGELPRFVDGRYELVDPDKCAKLGPKMFDDCGALRDDWRCAHSDRHARFPLLYPQPTVRAI